MFYRTERWRYSVQATTGKRGCKGFLTKPTEEKEKEESKLARFGGYVIKQDFPREMFQQFNYWCLNSQLFKFVWFKLMIAWIMFSHDTCKGHFLPWYCVHVLLDGESWPNDFPRYASTFPPDVTRSCEQGKALISIGTDVIVWRKLVNLRILWE